MRRFDLVQVLVLVAVWCSCVVLVSGNGMIFTDFTSNVSFTLLAGTGNPTDNDTTYNTSLPGGFTFGLHWNGDEADDFSIAAIGLTGKLIITPLNDVGFCALTSSGVTLNATIQQCNYSATWGRAFGGVMSITYNTGNSPGNPSAQQISIPFISGAPSGAFVVGDPQFVGLRGQSYQVHGLDGEIYNIISDSQAQVNARFVFLRSGQCPPQQLGAEVTSNCWSHPGSYLGELSFQQVVDGKLHRALITAGAAASGFQQVQVDDEVLTLGDSRAFGSFSVTFASSHEVVINMEQFEFGLTNSDRFVNQKVKAKTPLYQLKSHGLLGQTHSATTYPTALRYIAGDVDDYLLAGGDIYGNDFVYNQFRA